MITVTLDYIRQRVAIVANNFKINKQAVAQMSRDIEREFAKHPVKLPVRTDPSGVHNGGGDTYNAPVIIVNGDAAQLAWGNNQVTQTNAMTKSEDITPGYEAISQVIVSILEQIQSSGLDKSEVEEVENASRTVLAEVVKDSPDIGILKRSVTLIKGILAPWAMKAIDGAGDGIQEWAQTGIEQLGSGMSGLI